VSVSSRTMRLSTFCGLRRDQEHLASHNSDIGRQMTVRTWDENNSMLGPD
jgi:hypothetical protein